MPPRPDARELAQCLSQHAEAVCRHYLGNGRRQGGYWLVGDVHNTPGRSLFVRLRGPERGPGAAGHWTDAATGQHGDLLDLLRHTLGFADLTEAMDEANRFLGRPQHGLSHAHQRQRATPDRPDASEAARRLFARAGSVAGTLAETYLAHRGIRLSRVASPLRFHPGCLYRSDPTAASIPWPAMIAAVTDRMGHITGVQRTWLARDGFGKAPLADPRRALGDLRGHAVRFGVADDVLAAGEGIETMLSLRMVLPTMPVGAALSAGHLAALLFPPTLRRLYVARDNDPSGQGAASVLIRRAQDAGIEAVVLTPQGNDFNDDLFILGIPALRAQLRGQLVPEDVERFLQVGP